jgi:Ca2+-binding EF-hand superfamily protein
MGKFAGIMAAVYCFLFFICISVFAQQEQMRAIAAAVKGEFKTMDADKNGNLSYEEMQSYQKDKFNQLDADKNGTLDMDELKADTTNTHRLADKNMDGNVTAQESDSQFRDYFQQMDKDKNGQVSEAEYTDYWKLIYKF